MLKLKNLSVGYNDRCILHNINLVFEPGYIYTIIGKNGSGKSTLLKNCAGLLVPEKGCVLLDEKELFSYTPNERAKRISYLSQSNAVPNITVERLLAHSRFPHLDYPKKLRRNDWDIIHKALDDMKAKAFISSSLRELSGGERQRVYLAMQLAQDTSILLLDEPTTYLDIEYQLLLMELLKCLKKRGKTIVMVLHDLEQALRYSDRLIAFDEDQKLFFGTPDDFLSEGIITKIFHVEVLKNEYRFKLEK